MAAVRRPRFVHTPGLMHRRRFPLVLQSGSSRIVDLVTTSIARLPCALLLVASVLIAGSAPGAATERPPPATGPAFLEPRFIWPLSPEPALTRGFEAPADPYGPGHRGVDLSATPGQSVLAAGSGTVMFAGLLAGRGVVSVDHDGGLRTTYEPVAPEVSPGDQVYQGQALGAVEPGHPNCPAVACLHWGVRRDAEYINPLVLVAERSEIRLKPWGG